MSVEIKKQVEEPLLGRTIIIAKMSVAEKATPDRLHLRKELAKALKKPEEQVIIKKIVTGFGTADVDVEAAAYDKPEDAAKVESKALIAKHQPKPKKEN